MFASRLVFVALTVISFTSAFVTPPSKRDDADVLNILTMLKDSTDSILPQIDSLVASNQANSDSLTPLFDQVQDALTTATSSLEGLAASGTKKRQTDDELASLASQIIQDINTSTTNANTAAAPLGFPGVITKFSFALDKLLIDLDILVPGILKAVVILLDDVVGVVVALLFTLLG
ncbi:hypothetical protein CPB85DRAFT_1442899 [Mucidula mucida]|nr:hypothetical protein CPB85DRAFT_1442899 [Mucidula mucida]